jgi:aspartyl/glutamyl-tRNA(Asn/Gln) amidotransferase C subunit
MSTISKQQVFHVAQLATIPISDEEATTLTAAFTDTLATIDNLQEVDTAAVQPTHQVTGLTNVTRADEVDTKRMFTQQQALSNAKKTHQGYIVVPLILEKS